MNTIGKALITLVAGILWPLALIFGLVWLIRFFWRKLKYA